MALRKFNFDFVGKRKIYFTISSIILLAAVVLSFVLGVSLDISFKGGSIITYSYTGEIDLDAFLKTAEESIEKNFTITESTNQVSGAKNIVLTLAGQEGLSVDEQSTLNEALSTEFADNGVNKEEDTNVDPSLGKEFFAKCLVAILLAFVLIVIYVAIRFRKIGGWSAGVMGIIALLHDSVVVYLAFVIFQIPINDNFIAVVLTILGYSINDTIVIYDRIRENKQREYRNEDFGKLVNDSINQTLNRTVNVSVATIASILVVLIVSLIYGVDSIISFALPLLFGLVSGVYSTVCIAGPLWVTWRNFRDKHPKNPTAVKKKKKKAY